MRRERRAREAGYSSLAEYVQKVGKPREKVSYFYEPPKPTPKAPEPPKPKSTSNTRQFKCTWGECKGNIFTAKSSVGGGMPECPRCGSSIDVHAA